MRTRPVGLTRDAGWQVGASRTVPADVETVWDFLVSPAGVALWLGEGVPRPLTAGEPYETTAGTAGELRSVRPLDRVRLTWQPAGRASHATVQFTVRPAVTGCSVTFHAERLASAEEREAMRAHWRAVLDRVGAALASPPEVEHQLG